MSIRPPSIESPTASPSTSAPAPAPAPVPAPAPYPLSAPISTSTSTSFCIEGNLRGFAPPWQRISFLLPRPLVGLTGSGLMGCPPLRPLSPPPVFGLFSSLSWRDGRSFSSPRHPFRSLLVWVWEQKDWRSHIMIARGGRGGRIYCVELISFSFRSFSISIYLLFFFFPFLLSYYFPLPSSRCSPISPMMMGRYLDSHYQR